MVPGAIQVSFSCRALPHPQKQSTEGDYGRLPSGWTLPDSQDVVGTAYPVFRHLHTLEIHAGGLWVQWPLLHHTPLLAILKLIGTSLVPFPRLHWTKLRTLTLENCQYGITDLLEAIRLARRSLNDFSIINRPDHYQRFSAGPEYTSQPQLPLSMVDIIALSPHYAQSVSRKHAFQTDKVTSRPHLHPTPTISPHY